MKSDLFTTVAAAIAGFIIAYFVCNIFVGKIEDVSIPTIDSETSVKITDPNIELFNYRALNPAVEVYVGECNTIGENGECLDDDMDSYPNTPTVDNPPDDPNPEDD